MLIYLIEERASDAGNMRASTSMGIVLVRGLCLVVGDDMGLLLLLLRPRKVFVIRAL